MTSTQQVEDKINQIVENAARVFKHESAENYRELQHEVMTLEGFAREAFQGKLEDMYWPILAKLEDGQGLTAAEHSVLELLMVGEAKYYIRYENDVENWRREAQRLVEALKKQQANGVTIRRALVLEKQLVIEWVRKHFSPGWGNECDVAFSRQPVSCFIAVEEEQLLGFACYDATCLNFFGPTGVLESCRGRGVGKALLLACLHAMKWQGYAYAIIGWVGPAEFYHKIVGAVEIEGSSPGIYAGLLKGTISD